MARTFTPLPDSEVTDVDFLFAQILHSGLVVGYLTSLPEGEEYNLAQIEDAITVIPGVPSRGGDYQVAAYVSDPMIARFVIGKGGQRIGKSNLICFRDGRQGTHPNGFIGWMKLLGALSCGTQIEVETFMPQRPDDSAPSLPANELVGAAA